MSESVVKIKLCPGGIAPRRMSSGAVGFDIFAHLDEPIKLSPGKRCVVPAGFVIEIPGGYEAQIRPRSGWALKHGLTMLNSPGTIDPDYRGEVKVILANLGENDIIISNGERIAQMVLAAVPKVKFELVDSLSDSSRGENGFGSTGI